MFYCHFSNNFSFEALTHFHLLSKIAAVLSPWSLKLPNNLSRSHLIEMSESQTCHMSSPVARGQKWGGNSRCTLLFLSKCVNMVRLSCWKKGLTTQEFTLWCDRINVGIPHVCYRCNFVFSYNSQTPFEEWFHTEIVKMKSYVSKTMFPEFTIGQGHWKSIRVWCAERMSI